MMNIIQPGKVFSDAEVSLQGKCSGCGCVIEVSREEAEPTFWNFLFGVMEYVVDCPTANCGKRILCLKKMG